MEAISGLIAGPYGTGKSTVLGSAAELGPTILLATKPREKNSWLYRKHKTPVELYADKAWLPSLQKFEATGYLSLLQRLHELHDDDKYDFVLLDPMTDVVSLAAHEILKATRSAAPRDVGDTYGFYGTLRYKLKEITQAFTALTYAKRPKTVLASVHTQSAKEEDSKGKEHADKREKGVEYEGDVLPMIEGGYRREIGSEFDFMAFTFIEHFQPPRADKTAPLPARVARWGIQIVPNDERHAKNALGPAPATPEIYVDASKANPLKAILDCFGGV